MAKPRKSDAEETAEIVRQMQKIRRKSPRMTMPLKWREIILRALNANTEQKASTLLD